MRRAITVAGLLACAVALSPAFGVAAGASEQAGPPASAAPPPKPPVAPYTPPGGPPATPRYAAGEESPHEHCMIRAQSDPGAARDLAEHWQSRGGAHPADHCYAVALVGLKQYKEGATRLETLAQAMGHAPNSLRADVLDQAAQVAGSPAIRRAPTPPIPPRSICCRAMPTSSSTAPRQPAARAGTTRRRPISTACYRVQPAPR